MGPCRLAGKKARQGAQGCYLGCPDRVINFARPHDENMGVARMEYKGPKGFGKGRQSGLARMAVSLGRERKWMPDMTTANRADQL